MSIPGLGIVTVPPQEKYLSRDEDRHRRPQDAYQDDIRYGRSPRECEAGDRAGQKEARERFDSSDTYLKLAFHSENSDSSGSSVGLSKLML
jgi:hypothetical protein